MGGALHYYKASSMLCLFGFLKPRKFQLCVKDNVRSDCYGYAIIVSRGVHVRVCYILKAHFSEVRATYRRRQLLYKFTHKGFPRTSRAGK